jgi:hypothetical protein
MQGKLRAIFARGGVRHDEFSTLHEVERKEVHIKGLILPSRNQPEALSARANGPAPYVSDTAQISRATGRIRTRQAGGLLER